MSNKNKVSLPDDAIEVARIGAPWGIKGGVWVMPYSIEADVLFTVDHWYLMPPEPKFAGQSKKPTTQKSVTNSAALRAGIALPDLAQQPWPRILIVDEIREQGDGIVIMSDDITDRNMAEGLKGARVFVSRSDFPELEEGEFYWVDLIGLNVVNLQGEALGRVSDLMHNGLQSILRVSYEGLTEPAGAEQGHGQPERLIPFVDAYVDEVDLQNGVIRVDWQPDY